MHNLTPCHTDSFPFNFLYCIIMYILTDSELRYCIKIYFQDYIQVNTDFEYLLDKI